ncbi:MAG: antA/AntB antirepressor family protein [Candidatus Phlomobacter fragariae]
MSNLINIETKNINGGLIQTVNARDLHVFLESKQDFSTWIKKRISEYGFVENKDFIRLHKKMEANNATAIDYHISLDMAKELSMVERNEKGKQARHYFIECEKRVLQPTLPTNYVEALEALLTSEKEKAVITDQRDEAVRTKSRISRKREATALQRNSTYKRMANRAIQEREKMAARLGASKEWASQQAVWRATGKMFGWKVLNAWLDKHDIYDTITLGFPTSFNPDQNSREVIYPREAWLEIYGIDIAELF